MGRRLTANLQQQCHEKPIRWKQETLRQLQQLEFISYVPTGFECGNAPKLQCQTSKPKKASARKNAPRLGFCQPLAADDLAAAPGTDQAGRPNKVQKMRMHNLFAEN